MLAPSSSSSKTDTLSISFRIRHTCEASGISKHKNKHIWTFVLKDKSPCYQLNRHEVHFSYNARSGKREIREDGKQIFSRIMINASGEFVHEWFGERGKQYKIQQRNWRESPIFSINTVPFCDFPTASKLCDLGSSDQISDEELGRLELKDVNEELARREVYTNDDIDMLFSEAEEGHPLISASRLRALRNMGHPVSKDNVISNASTNYWIIPVTILMSLAAVNIAARYFPLAGQSMMMEEREIPLCTYIPDNSCEYASMIEVSVPAENHVWPEGLSWAVSRDRTAGLAPEDELRAIESAVFFMNKNMFLAVDTGNCDKFTTALCLSGDYILKVNSVIPSSHVVNVCNQEVPATQELGFSTTDAGCTHDREVYAEGIDYSEVHGENNTNWYDGINRSNCSLGLFCPPTLQPTLFPTPFPSSTWSSTKNCEFLGFFCHSNSSTPTASPTRFPTPMPLLFTFSPVAPLEIPTFSPSDQFHLPPELGGPPTDDDSKGQSPVASPSPSNSSYIRDRHHVNQKHQSDESNNNEKSQNRHENIINQNENNRNDNYEDKNGGNEEGSREGDKKEKGGEEAHVSRPYSGIEHENEDHTLTMRTDNEKLQSRTNSLSDNTERHKLSDEKEHHVLMMEVEKRLNEFMDKILKTEDNGERRGSKNGGVNYGDLKELEKDHTIVMKKRDDTKDDEYKITSDEHTDTELATLVTIPPISRGMNAFENDFKEFDNPEEKTSIKKTVESILHEEDQKLLEMDVSDKDRVETLRETKTKLDRKAQEMIKSSK